MADLKEHIEKYREKRADLCKRIDDLDQRRNDLEQQVDDIDTAIRVTEGMLDAPPAKPWIRIKIDPPIEAKDTNAIGFKSMSIADAAAHCIQSNKKSMRASEIAAWLLSQGFETTASNFGVTVSGTLKRNTGQRFQKRNKRWSVRA